MRCAYCHDQLELEHHRCDDCGTLLHFDCSQSLPSCPTLGCAALGVERSPIPIRVREILGRPTRARLVAWFLFGLLFPLLAFALDTGLHANPLIWGEELLNGVVALDEPQVPQRLPLAHLAVVWGSVALSALGLILFALGRTRASLPLLTWGVVVSGAHALAFVPLAPYSLIGIAFVGIGLLGFLPYVTFWVFLDAARRARSALQDDEAWGQSLFVNEESWAKRRFLLVGAALFLALGCFLSPRPETFHSPGRYVMSYVDFERVREDAQLLLQPDSPRASEQALERLHTDFENYARGTTPYGPGFIGTGPGRVLVDWSSSEPRPQGSALTAPNSDREYAHWVWIMADPDELPPAPAGSRSVEYAPGVWSQWQHTPRESGAEPEFQHLSLW